MNCTGQAAPILRGKNEKDKENFQMQMQMRKDLFQPDHKAGMEFPLSALHQKKNRR